MRLHTLTTVKINQLNTYNKENLFTVEFQQLSKYSEKRNASMHHKTGLPHNNIFSSYFIDGRAFFGVFTF